MVIDGFVVLLEIFQVEYLLGSSNRLENIVVLGLLTQLKETQHHLEDDTGAVQLVLTDAKFHTGELMLFMRNRGDVSRSGGTVRLVLMETVLHW